MSAWKKYLILFAVLFGLGAAATWFLGQTKLPPELQPESVQLHLGKELDFMRQLVRDMPAEVPPMPELPRHGSSAGTSQTSDTNAENEAARLAKIAELTVAWDEVEQRAEEFEHPAIRAAAVQIRVGSTNRVRMVLHGSHRFHRGWSMGKKQPTLGHPVVSKVFGTRRLRIHYQELVETTDGKERSFDLIIDADYLLDRASAQTTPEPAAASPTNPK
jgi:hypothetical protein